jgi:hypothetical protein
MAEQWNKGKPELASKIIEIRDELDKNNYSDISQWELQLAGFNWR